MNKIIKLSWQERERVLKIKELLINIFLEKATIWDNIVLLWSFNLKKNANTVRTVNKFLLRKEIFWQSEP